MTKLYSVFIALLCTITSFAQTNLADYSLSTSTSTYTPIAGGTVVASAGYDNQVSAAISLGGTFTFGGVAFTNCYISANGYITFGAAPSGTNYTPLSTLGSTTGAISAFGQDAGGSTVSGAAPEVSYLNIGGSTGEFVVQYKDHANYYNRTVERLNFQIRLNLATNEITIVYGTCTDPGSVSASGTSVQVGIRGNTTTFATNVNNLMAGNIPSGTTCDWSSAVTGNSNSSSLLFHGGTNVNVKIPTGLTLTWTPNVVSPVRTFSAVTNITADGATISWTAPTGVTQYNVRYRAVGTCAWTNYTGNPVAGTTVTFTGLTTGTAYQVQVQSLNGTNTSTWSHIPNSAGTGDGYIAAGTFTPLAACVAPTEQPSNLILTTGATSVSGSFTAPGTAPSGYLVIRTNTNIQPAPVDGTVYTVGTNAIGYIESAGTALTFTSSNLSPTTQYYYWVFAYNNTSCIGGPIYQNTAPLTSNITTAAPQAYVWNATTGTADASIATNWTPNRTVPDASDTLYFSNGGSSTISNLTTSTVAKIAVINNTAIAATSAATATVSIKNELIVANGSTLDIASASSLTLNFTSGTNATATISGALKASGSATTTYNTTNGVTTVLPTGTIEVSNSGTITGGTAARLFFAAGSSYTHARNAGTVPTANYDASSTVNITGSVAGVPGMPAVLGNVVVNSPAQTANGTWSSSVDTIKGNLIIQSTGTGRVEGGNGPAIRVMGNLILNGGTLAVGNFTSSSGFIEVFGNTELNAGTLLLSSATSGTGTYELRARGNFTQLAANTINRLNTLAGTIATIAFVGTTSQSINIAGTITNNISFKLDNVAGATLTGTVPVNLNGFNTMTNGNYTGSGSFSYNATTSTLIYNSAVSQTATVIEFPFVNGPSNLTINKSASTVLVLPFSRTVRGTLTMTAGDIDLGSNSLTLGTSAAAAGTLTWTAGNIRVTTGNFTRWFATTGLPTAAGTAIGYFPMAAGTVNRNASIYFSTATALSTGGSITVGVTDNTGLSTVAVADGAYNIERRTNAFWTIAQSGLVATGTIGLRLTAGNLFNTTTPANLRLMQQNSITGTHVAGGGVFPNFQASRSGLTVATLAQQQYIGAALADINSVYTSITSGNFGDGTTWDAGTAPGASDVAFIANGHNVTVNGANTAGILTINGGGTLTVPGNSLTIGSNLINNGTINLTAGNLSVGSTLTNEASGNLTINGGTLDVTGGSASGIANNGIITLTTGTVNVSTNGLNNRSFTNNSASTLNVAGGTLNIYGNLAINNGANFSQSGGNIVIDGNNGGATATSVGSTLDILGIGNTTTTYSSGTISLTGGNITLVDPHASTSTSVNTIGVRIAAVANNVNAANTHTIQLGDGISTDAGGIAGGYVYNNWVNTGGLRAGNLVINAAPGTNRIVSSGYKTLVGNNFTILNGEYRSTSDIAIGGNLTVASGATLTQSGVTVFAVPTISSGTAFTQVPSAIAQSITAAGTIRNSATTVTANLAAVTINNSHSGVTISNDLSLSGTLTFTLGRIITGTAKLMMNAGTTVSGAGASTGWVQGNLQKNVATGATARTFEIGDAAGYRPVAITFGSVTTAGDVTATVSQTAGDHTQSLNSGIDVNKSVNRFWTLTNSGVVFDTYSAVFNFIAADVDAAANTANFVVRNYNGATWSTTPTGTLTATSAQATGLTTFGEFAIGETTGVPVVSTQPVVSAICAASNTSFSSASTSIPAPTVQWERSVDGTSWVTITGTLDGSIYSNFNTGTLNLTNVPVTVHNYQYRAVFTNINGSNNSNAVTLTVNAPTVGGTVASDQTICSGTAPADLVLSGNVGSVVKWQKIGSGPFSTPVDIASTSTTLTSAAIGALTETSYFRAVVKNGACAETFSSPVTITVSSATVAGTVAGAQTICSGNTPGDLTLTGNTGIVVKWQRSNDAAFTSPTDISSTSTTLSGAVIGSLSQNTYFRAVVQNAGCSVANSNAVLITINNTVDNSTPLAGTIGGGPVCANYNVSTTDYALNNCNLIARIQPSGASPVTGTVNACVKIDGSVQIAPTGEPYVQRHYDVMPASNATNATSTITLYFLQSEFNAFNTARGFYAALPANGSDATGKANLRITQYNGNGTAPGNYPAGSGSMLDPDDANIVFNAAANRWEITFNPTGSGGFYVHTGNFTLPVTLINFRGEQSGSINKLLWSTSTETNNKGFELERSSDGRNYSSITFVASKAENGNSNSTMNYNYNDVRPLAGNNYYRLKQTDKDGKTTFSNVVLLSSKVADITLSSVYPNPTMRELNIVITSPKTEKVNIIVTDLTGKVLMQRGTELAIGDNQQTFNVQQLAAGTYFIKAVCANGCETAVQRFVKQ